jgi:peptidyl-prolyl isomerase E (cyclophilin E)
MTEKATLYVGNLVPEVDEDSLRAAFIPFGEIKSVDIPIDHVTGIIPFYYNILEQPKGFAHIEFEESEDCEHAIFNMNESEFFGKVIRVQYAKPSKLKSAAGKSVW